MNLSAASAATASAPPVPDFDHTDQRIVDSLRADGRMPCRALAKALGITETTARARVKRLEQSQLMRVVAVTDFEAAGYDFMLAVAVQVENRSPAEVAAELAKFSEVFSINVVIGAYHLELLVVAETQAALTSLIYQRMAGLAGVRRVVPSLAINVLKNQPDWVPFHDTMLPVPPAGRRTESKRRLDPVDHRIVEWLSRDARTSNRQIAQQLGVTEGTVRARIRRMEAKKLIRITAVTNIASLRDAALAYVWVDVEHSAQIDRVARQMAAMQEFGFVGVMMGRCDILGITLVRSTEQLARFVHRHISGLTGVRRTESTLSVNFVKHDYRKSRIVS